jgi:eukaryotic-like serine/threonine-protein kinase
MKGLAQSVSGIETGTRKCEQCGATTRLGDGMCLSCFLKEGLEPEQQASIAAFETVLAEADVPDKQWRLGNYEIVEEIGRGGMGVIYRARQRHSRRIVALKRMLTYHADSHETLARFRREAETAATLDHPNILPIYEVSETEDGLPFFSMKLATGGSLRTIGPSLRNEPRQCVQLIAKVARAIEYAHAQGVLHRDLQPGNILLDARGEPLVSDFGLAKWLSEESNLTRTLTTFGTPGYIAPEQAEGRDFSPAADIYSLGAILFSLLAGRPPFVGANALSVIRQAAETPAPKLRSLAPSLGRDLETIVGRCLERHPKARYQSASALAEDLERWLEGRPIIARPVRASARIWRWSRRNPILAGAAAACLFLTIAVSWLLRERLKISESAPPPQKSIAVLPFQNLTNDPENAFFTDGIQEEILTRLSKVAALKVISRTSTQQFAGARTDLRKVAQKLGVAHVLEGSVQKTADKLRVNVQLIEARNDRHVWAETYDRNLSDVFQAETDIARNIASKLEANLTHREAEAVAALATSNSAAYELYLKGRYFWNKRNPEGFRKALDFFLQATKLDPNYARAYAGMADTYLVMPTYDLCSGKECFPLGRAAVLKALELDDSLAEAHAGYGGLLASEYKWTEARRHLEQAIELDPNYAIAHEMLGLEVLMNLGEVDRGLAELRQAQELDPLSLIVNTLLGMAHYRLHEYEQARTQLRKTLELDPNFHLAREVLAQTFDMQGRFDEAIVECRKALETSDAPGILATLGHTYARAGNRNDALKVLEQLQQQSQKRVVTAVNFAWMYIALGEKEEAMNWLEKAYDDGSLYGIKLDPFLDPLRDEPRFKRLLARVFSQSETTSPVSHKGIAVLPFENLDNEKANSYFAAGIQDEILSSLAKVADLTVIKP